VYQGYAVIVTPSFPRTRESRFSFREPPVKGGWVYLLADRYRGALYTGVTANIARRTWQHREGSGSRHAAKYGIKRLVFAEHAERIEDAIAREKAIKKWRRAWKIELIESANPDWDDLYERLNG
jgi:putative endonuclease